MMCKTICISNQKGGVAKTTTAVSLSACLSSLGYKVLLVDLDPQGNATTNLLQSNPDELTDTIFDVFDYFRQNPSGCEGFDRQKYILNSQGVDFIPSNIELALMETNIVNVMCRELILKRIIEPFSKIYDFILVDTAPSLGLLTINAYVASDSIIIPLGADDYYSAKGLESLISTILNVRMQINPTLEVEGVLFTKLDMRTNLSKEIYEGITSSYGDVLNIFDTKIPISTKVAESSSRSKTILEHDPKGRVACAYMELAKEVLRSHE